MPTLRLNILSPTGPLYQGDVASVIVPAHDGLMGVLPGHAPLVALLKPGTVTAHPAPDSGSTPSSTRPLDHSTTRPLSFPVSGGFCRVSPDSVTILAELPTTWGSGNSPVLTAAPARE